MGNVTKITVLVEVKVWTNRPILVESIKRKLAGFGDPIGQHATQRGVALEYEVETPYVDTEVDGVPRTELVADGVPVVSGTSGGVRSGRLSLGDRSGPKRETRKRQSTSNR